LNTLFYIFVCYAFDYNMIERDMQSLIKLLCLFLYWASVVHSADDGVQFRLLSHSALNNEDYHVRFSKSLELEAIEPSNEVTDTVSSRLDTTSYFHLADSSVIQSQQLQLDLRDVSFADSVILYDPGALGQGTGDEPDIKFQKSENALGTPDFHLSEEGSFVSLGRGGILVLKFVDNVLVDGPGPDINIFKPNINSDDVFVWISHDGFVFFPVGKTSGGNTVIDIHQKTKPNLFYPYIKLKDDPAQGGQNGAALGADIDAVGAINTAIYQVIQADLLFSERTAKLTSEAPGILSEIGDLIRKYDPTSVSIEVHTDSWGTEDFNLMLSQEQAGIVQNYLFDIEKLKEMGYSIVGWGEIKPIASNSTEEGRYRNRRIEMLIRLKSQ
jgi:outer membrane protein OmpA-like peptidoglycan-associated protein